MRTNIVLRILRLLGASALITCSFLQMQQSYDIVINITILGFVFCVITTIAIENNL
ncbi:hypothetical protein SAMN05216353_15814 [Halobacillus alkaliphilus]|uniref:Uncharacterized protein n=1 Tax=Halobacillus alkaliphilus TaxID=396056 RepID=A0A1I2SXZ1_9BACI|nr:hypothetical protein [Halobacillus alkaliphilus]SFG57594.1 hypothetical protein SAMN05216353_15814 [Halobacillus alkaliphilus]